MNLDELVEKLQKWFWAGVVFCTVLLNIFYFGYFREVGIAFIGMLNVIDVFYNVSSLFVLIVGFGIFSLFVAMVARRKIVLIGLSFAIMAVGALVLFVGKMDYGNTATSPGFFTLFIGLALLLVITFTDAPTNNRGMLILAVFVVSSIAFYEGGRAFARAQINLYFSSRYQLITSDGVIDDANILRTGDRGVLYAKDGRIIFLTRERVFRIERSY